MVPGGVVISKAGRDAGSEFIIIKVPEDRFVYVCDGRIRRIEKPKKKNIRHLEYNGTVIDILNEKLNNNMKVTNAEIRKALESYKEIKK
jgi:large subunit ribosomal protein L14e